mmetsp:Transcript_87274/g.151039  ORF Transcript_87274/g.151039 Transcript_87274/m.151039 type:complete len:644 (+) Transcript_87274:128-2059(+)
MEASRRSRRERDASRSYDESDRDRKRRREKDKKEKREKQEDHYERRGGDHQKKARQDGYGDGHRRNDDRHGQRGRDAEMQSRGRDSHGSAAYAKRGKERGGDRPAEAERSTRGRTGSGEQEKEKDRAPTPASAAKNSAKNWREEMENQEDERDLSDDEETTARKLADSRKRREAMMAKWMTTDKKENEEDSAEMSRQASGGKTGAAADDAPSSDSEAGEAEKGEQDEASRAKKQEVTNFILEQRAQEEKTGEGDMFDESADAAAKLKTGHRQSSAIGLTGASGEDWDDTDGYYIAQIGELMDERYLVVENACGKGVFSNVVKAKDQVDKENGLVAIKVMRANDMMKKAAEKEIEILERLNKADRGNKRHVIRLLTTFYYRKHLCLVFECMWDDLRAALKKYTKNKGMALQAVRAYTKQLMIGLRHIHKCQIIHADIKPDNILISEGHNVVKFCDLGTALDIKDVAISPYLVSRFYRAPEIVLGCEYTIAVDVFALGATLCELFTGKVLLTSKTNNEHLRKIMEIKGKIPGKVIKKGMLWKSHFNEDLDFTYQDTDKVTKDPITRVITDLSAKKDMTEIILERVGDEKRRSEAREDQQYVQRAKQFADLLSQMLALDPEKRVTANDALNHPFLADPPVRGAKKG